MSSPNSTNWTGPTPNSTNFATAGHMGTIAAGVPIGILLSLTYAQNTMVTYTAPYSTDYQVTAPKSTNWT